MENIIEFSNQKEWETFLKNNRIKRNIIGIGSEGSCYLLPNGMEVFKVFDNDEYSTNYDVKGIITMSDINLKFFALPKKLYVIKDKLVGCTTKYIRGDVLTPNLYNELGNVNFNRLIKAYEITKKDVIELSKHNIKIFDLACNLLFDNKNLYGIDTCGYTKENENIYEHNLDSYDYAIRKELEFLSDDVSLDPNSNLPINEYIMAYKELSLKKSKS